MKERFSTACKLVGALVFSLTIMMIPITATILYIQQIYPIAFIIFGILTMLEFITLGIVLFNATNDNKTTSKTTKK